VLPEPDPPFATVDTKATVPSLDKGFHLFDDQYVLLGFNFERPCQATALELETSYVPFVTHGLWWFGAYATAGFQTRHATGQQPPSQESPCFEDSVSSAGDKQRPDPVQYPLVDSELTLKKAYRFGGGLEAGWRMIGFDAGLLYNGMLRARKDDDPVVAARQTDGAPMGYRFRLGLALSDEVFTAHDATYNRSCCKEKKECSATICECERTPVGVSLFLYYGNELYVKNGRVWDDGLVGLSLKIGVGL
jgi:hypothetical protein